MKLILIILTGFGLISCSTPPKKLGTGISLDFEGIKGHKDLYAIHSETLVENISPDKMLHQKIDTVEFEVETTISKVDKKPTRVVIDTKTIKKEGSLSLHDMAYPELNETIKFAFDSKGRVLEAGKNKPDSIFFVSPLPLPNKKVKVGDTWNYEAQWLAQQSQFIMKLNLVMILKKIIPCYDNEQCAEIEWSGYVAPSEIKLPVKSEIKGYALYRPKTASQIWTWSRNEEKLDVKGAKVKVATCVQSILKSETSEINPFANKAPYCDPSKPTAPTVLN